MSALLEPVPRSRTVIVVAALFSALMGCQPKAAPVSVAAGHDFAAACPNTVALFIDGGEVQCEDCTAIERALSDLATKPDAELRAARYADYRGEPGAWDLQTVLLRHVMFDRAYASAVKSGCCDVGGDCFWSLLDEAVREAAGGKITLDSSGRP